MSSFTARLTLRFALLVTATTMGVLVGGGLLLNHQIEHGLEMQHATEAKELSRLLGNDAQLTPQEVERLLQHDADSDAALFFIQVGERERILFRSDNLGETLLPFSGEGGPNWTVRLPYLGRLRLSTFQEGPWQIVIGSSLANSERLLQNYTEISLGLVAVVGLVSLGLGYGFSRKTLEPIRVIETTARRIRADNLGERIPVSGRDEVAALAALLNETFDRLQASFEQVRRFSADASHELKTPLALMRLNIEKLRARLQHDADSAAALDDVLEELAQMNGVIERLLFIAKSESGALALTRCAVELAPWLENFAEDARVLAEDRGVRFVLGDNAPGTLLVDRDLVRQLLLNLVTNAVTASPAGGVVMLDSRAVESGWCFVVSDEGTGLPQEQLGRVFERFVRYQAQAEEREPVRGHGLGLAICKAIVELHGGRIRATNRPDRAGLRVVVELPLPPAD